MNIDIAFAVGVLTLLGDKIPPSLKIMLTALAIVDDMGAIVVIALFYSKGISVYYLLLVALVISILIVMNVTGIRNVLMYIIGGVFLWFFILNSGIHATIAGVLLGITGYILLNRSKS